MFICAQIQPKFQCSPVYVSPLFFGRHPSRSRRHGGGKRGRFRGNNTRFGPTRKLSGTSRCFNLASKMAANGEPDDCPGVEAETSFEVRLYIYDLSKELSKSFKKILKGKPLPGIWHTGLVAYGREYYFSSSGIESCRPGETILGEPDQILTLGKTELPYSVFLEYIFALGESGYRPGTYHLLEHNCNAFSQEVSTFLTGGPIPEELRFVPDEILQNKTLSNTLKEYFDKLSFRAEGSKGISFGTISNHQGRRSSSDLQQIDRINGNPLPNGHSSEIEGNNNNNPPPQPSKKSSQTSKLPEQKTNTMVNGNSSVDHGPEQPQQQQKNANEAAAAPPVAAPPAVSENSAAAAVTNAEDVGAAKAENNAPPQPVQAEAPHQEAVQPSAEAAKRPEPAPATAGAPTGTHTAAPERRSDAANAVTEPPTLPADVDSAAAGDRRESTEGDSAIPSFTARRSRKYQDPPIIYQEIDGLTGFKKLFETVQDKISNEEKQAMNEIQEYLMSEGGAWALGQIHLDTIGRLLNDRNLPSEVPVQTLHVLQSAVLKEDVILLLHQDRKDHHIMSYLYRIENLPHDEQEEITKLMCNLCYNASSFDWLMYISEWEEQGRSCNNSKVTVRVAVHSLLCDQPTTQEKGSALMYNLALKELFDDTATELAMAVIQFLHADLSEEHAFRSLTSLLRFLYISYNDVPALLKMLGPDVRKFSGKSERVDELIEQIQFKLSVSASA